MRKDPYGSFLMPVEWSAVLAGSQKRDDVVGFIERRPVDEQAGYLALATNLHERLCGLFVLVDVLERDADRHILEGVEHLDAVGAIGAVVQFEHGVLPSKTVDERIISTVYPISARCSHMLACQRRMSGIT